MGFIVAGFPLGDLGFEALALVERIVQLGNPFASSRPAINNSKRSVRRGSVSFLRESGEISVG